LLLQPGACCLRVLYHEIDSGFRPHKEHDMGKGDKRTRKGKIYRGSHGNTRLRKGKSPASAPAAPARKTARKTARKK
jgi:ribosomal small subunit protein bTHX